MDRFWSVVASLELQVSLQPTAWHGIAATPNGTLCSRHHARPCPKPSRTLDLQRNRGRELGVQVARFCFAPLFWYSKAQPSSVRLPSPIFGVIASEIVAVKREVLDPSDEVTEYQLDRVPLQPMKALLVNLRMRR